ncbi:MAG TPA: protein phosphatase 2C domain-containing protein [Pelomicrobium sp.]|nr:protein phosphatase 2C domain-containing protein [Pelomicrobium sp.]
MNVEIAQVTRIGGRRINQDRVASVAVGEAVLLVLADGMGGTQRGEVAADIALEVMLSAFREAAAPVIGDPAAFFHDTIERAHLEILRYARDQNLWDPPGSTCVACLVQRDTAWWAHVGDSRCYLLRNGQIAGRTRDHSLFQDLVDMGRIRDDDAGFHPERGVLTSCLGGFEAPRTEVAPPVALAPGDVVMLCSDGLWGQLPESELASALADEPLAPALEALAKAADREAGRLSDNVTAIALRWHEGTAPGARITRAAEEPAG